MLRIVGLAIGALAAAALAIPGADTPGTAEAATRGAEAELIASLREMAQAPVSADGWAVALQAPDPSEIPAEPATEVAAVTPNERLVVQPDALNLRAEPSTEAEVLGRLLRGEAVAVEGRDGGWVRVATAAGATGWAHADYLAAAAN